MSGRELNKIIAAVLLAGFVASVSGNLSDMLYQPVLIPTTPGYVVENIGTPNQAASTEPVKPLDIPALMAAADPQKGQDIFKKCAACHTDTKDGPNRIGPNLWDIINRTKGTHPGFAYSSAMAQKGGQWTYADLFDFLKSPKSFVQGTKMSFIGLNKPEEIADLLAYLRTMNDNPVPLPTK